MDESVMAAEQMLEVLRAVKPGDLLQVTFVPEVHKDRLHAFLALCNRSGHLSGYQKIILVAAADRGRWEELLPGENEEDARRMRTFVFETCENFNPAVFAETVDLEIIERVERLARILL
jgi:hypothetical protein